MASPTHRVETFSVRRGAHEATFGGSWYRGKDTSFIPSKAELLEADAVDKFILFGWLPKRPFISKATPITAFGSCFAKHITDHLVSRDYNVLGRDLNMQAHVIRFGEGIVNSFAIRQQFEWALNERSFPEHLWFGPNKEIASLDPEIRRATYEIFHATETFLITLGLSEIWYDKRTGDAFWRAIPAQMFDEGIHGFRLSTPQENLDNLEVTVKLIRRINPKAKIVFTLSPIPLMATFRPISCLTANSVSKAVLRVAIDQLMHNRKDDEGLFYWELYT